MSVGQKVQEEILQGENQDELNYWLDAMEALPAS
jgi:hypothetical protein